MSEPNISILVVDDEPAICRSLTAYLEDCGFSLQSATSAEKALDIIRERHIDIVIVDLRLPCMSGDAMIAQAHEIAPHVRYIIHTGSIGYSLSEELKKIGLSEENIFTKPITNLTALVAAIRMMVKEKRNGNAR